MASISSVITGGFGVPGSASLVITDGYGTAANIPATTLRGRSRRGRRPLWTTDQDDGKKRIDAQALKDEREYVEALQSVHDLLAEQQILRDALDVATTRQRKTISTMIETIERRVIEIEDENVAIVLLT